MSPFNAVTAAVSLVAKSFSGFCTSTPARCTRIFFSVNVNPIKCLSSQTTGPPKRPLNGYLRFVLQQKPSVTSQNPESKPVDIIRKLAHQWRMLSPEQKQPFQDASVQALKQFKVDLQMYQAQLSPAQLQQQIVEKRQRMAKRKAIRKKRELTILGKPKRPRTAFNIFMSEHFQEARGGTTQAKLKSLLEDWRNLFSHQKQVYTQLAEDDKIRYKNEMKAWEDHMVEIGREDLIREKTHASKKKARAKSLAAKKKPKKAKAVKKSSSTRKLKLQSKSKQSSSAKTVKGSSKKI